MFRKLSGFRSRKIIHYALLICILLIQLLIASFFYNEFITRKNLAFFEKQLKEVNVLDNLTDTSRKELLNAQNCFQNYIIYEDKKYLDYYFASLHKLGGNLESMNHYGAKYPRLNRILTLQKSDSLEIKKLKSLIDSTYEYSAQSNIRVPNSFPKLQSYNAEYNFDRFNVETKTFSDTVKKKGLFGRLGDAISGKESVRKDSVVVTVKQGKVPVSAEIKAEVDSIMNQVTKHYTGQIRKIQVTVTEKQNSDGKFYRIFSKLLVYSNGLMNIYDVAIKGSKADLQKEYDKQNSENNRIRTYLIFGAMVLMFIVSILIMFLTRIAFIYEKRLNAANEQIKENLNFKNRILGMLSHELRSPLKIIGLFIGRINKKTEDRQIKEYLKSISFTNDSLLLQANQILEYTKNQAVENKLIPVKFNLKNEITSILTSIEPYIQTRNNTFIVRENIHPDLDVYSDSKKINQIFMNILGNANKFTENGQITVKVKTEPVDEDTISLITRISDTGAGISNHDLEKIFEPYYQGVLSEDVENLGAGLGLSLCKEIVELYSGHITVESETGKGTTVTFTVNLNLINEQDRS
ncbi:HAMP domain-containing histidine kinase [Chryseobacterium sp. SN22]|uniref:sensor histidine kinase n=1 Tax=Chryseobacterium sp. SN22 TaxID=2606431 RepID=UPI0011EC712A|nr:HAMP domain-containing sensor histidine kinase [Chryseobacterium sp. SN22]KAA0128986.1 HAMP domain-containing histidine kinase [Chryseobacterium sp. SN22]